MGEVYKAKLNDEGRLVIPAAARKELGLQSGQEVIVRVTDQGLLISTFEQSLKRFQDEVTRLVGPGRSLADELIAERR
ncbi:MAG TPA: AbrB/MazE/SpoVT family DNA-binding domain-containing protein, partial [Gemmataceae bacterium]|nr:AbrB/MazE/SpoVT family DNA-binding domain-containing protein [Gemmataceae bacterium]